MSLQFVFTFFDFTPQFGMGIFFSDDFLDFWSTLAARGGHIFRLFLKILFDLSTTHTKDGVQSKIKWKYIKTWPLWFFEYLLNNGKSLFSYYLKMIKKQTQKSPILAKIGRMIDLDLLNNVFPEAKVIASLYWPWKVIPQILLF